MYLPGPGSPFGPVLQNRLQVDSGAIIHAAEGVKFFLPAVQTPLCCAQLPQWLPACLSSLVQAGISWQSRLESDYSEGSSALPAGPITALVAVAQAL